MPKSTDELKGELSRAVDRREANDAAAAKDRELIAELIAELRSDPHNVGVTDLSRLAKVSPQAVYKVLDR